jgi:hypothetical protein
MSYLISVGSLSLLALAISCGSAHQDKKDKNKSEDLAPLGDPTLGNSDLNPSGNSPDDLLGQKGGDRKNGKQKSGDKGSKPAGSDGSGKNPPSGNPSQNPGSGGDINTKPGQTPSNPAGLTGEQAFTTRVLPVYRQMCISCHADPRQPAEVRAPLSIYSYQSMKAFLDIGAAPEDNKLWNLVRNFEPHTGGDRCKDGKTQSPCKEMIDWWIVEKGPPPAGAGQVGRITDVTSLGRVYGYAFDPQNSAVFVQVNFYIDGPKGTGTSIGSTMANKPGDDGNQPGDHSFSLDLPEAYRNGKAREIFAYALIGNEEKAISSVGYKYTAYSFTQAGRDFYNANVQGRMGGCGGCHTISYEQQFYSMIAPSPAKGGTATNNQLINKAAQTNGASHGGGQSCGNPNASPCAEFQRWWQVEFGAQP